MSYHEAIRDKIPMEKDSSGYTSYYPPCEYCGASVKSWAYQPSLKYVCNSCREMILDRRLNEKTSTKEKRLDSAIRKISKVAKIENYQTGICWVKNNLDHPGWFQSSEEIMTALELIRKGVKAYHQVRVFDYHVDFVLPDMKVALEIDGSIYHDKSRKEKEVLRDEIIAEKLGKGYEVIRINTDCIDQNVTMLVPAIKAVLKRRKSKKCAVECS